jgi:hypothetical protein
MLYILDKFYINSLLVPVSAHGASNSDNHDIAMVHNVRAKLRLNRANGMVNISEDLRSIFSWVKPFWVKRDLSAGWMVRAMWPSMKLQPLRLWR